MIKIKFSNDSGSDVFIFNGMLTWMLFIVVGIIALMFFFRSFFALAEGEVATVIKFGGKAIETPINQAGLHSKNPFNGVIKYSTKATRYSNSESVYTADQQTLAVEYVLNYRLDGGRIIDIVKRYGSVSDFLNNIVLPAIKDGLKNSFAQYKAQDITSRREEISEMSRKKISDALENYPIEVLEFRNVNEDFSDIYEKAVEDKQVALQKAQQAENELKEAKLKAEAMQVQSAALAQSKNLIEYEIVKNQAEAIKKWNGALPNTMLPNTTVPFIGKL